MDETVEEVFHQHPEWKVFSLTYVEYPTGDALGKALALLSLAPLAIVVASVSVFAVKRDLHTMAYGAGMIGNGIVNYVLKHLIREPRPKPPSGARDDWKLWEQFGMPSSHSQFMWFFCTYIGLFLFVRLHHQGRCLEVLWKSFASFSCFSLALLVSYGRIYLHYHTMEQVLWGALGGSALAILWFMIVQLILTPWFPWIASTRLAEFLMIRDDTLIPNVAWFEYTNSRGEAQKRLRKLNKNKLK